VLLLLVCGFVALSVPAYYAFTTLVNATISQLGTLFAEKQIQFDRSRGLGALMQEVTLAETLARSPVMADWARDESDTDKKQRAIAELEQYRASFVNHAWFFIVAASGNYYYNDAANARRDDPFAYTLHRDNPRDGWYYTTLAMGQGCHLNVDHDDVLAVTNVWINCVVRDGDTVLGMLGTGIDLSAFVRQVVDFPQQGVQAMFVDGGGAIQAHRDPRYIDFHSLTNVIETKKTIFSLLDLPADRQALSEMMKQVTGDEAEVRSRFMQIDGRSMLVGVGYLDGLGWYNVTIMDVDRIIDRSLFLPLGALVAGVALLVALAIALIVKFTVVDRLTRLERGVVAVKDGDRTPVKVDTGNDEIGRLSRSITKMADAVQDDMRVLERMVEERTLELRSLAYRDQLTGIANRRGFSDSFGATTAAAAPDARLALLLIDIDRFKEINDTYGHQAGDEVAIEIGRRIGAVLRPTDCFGRWGGDEFIVLFSDLGSRPLKTIAEAIRRGLSHPVELRSGQSVAVTVSIGACLVEPGETVEQVADMADAALYVAKDEGRDRVVVYDPTRARSEAGRRAG
jgi:diguanylate cyclase (GGDEF)-like protein